jgi:hypothetical protein
MFEMQIYLIINKHNALRQAQQLLKRKNSTNSTGYLQIRLALQDVRHLLSSK